MKKSASWFASILLAATLGAGVSSALNAGASPSPSPVIYYGCDKAGTLTLVGTSVPRCPAGAIRISWNQVGPSGAIGPRGNTGVQGPKGDVGATGIQGLQGLQGLKGDTGTAGLQGSIGPKGDAGATGPQGPAGPQANSACSLSAVAGVGGSSPYVQPLNLGGCVLNGLDFTAVSIAGGSNLAYAQLVGATITYKSLQSFFNGSSSQAASTNFLGSNLTDASLAHSNLQGANFGQANLTGTDFTNANLVSVDFTKAISVDSDFTGAHLTSANFTGATVTNPTYSTSTICPNGIFFGTSGANCP